MIRTWIADITPLYDETCYRKYYEQLPKFRQMKADRLKLSGDRARSAGAWILYQRIREKHAVPEEAVYNLSHSGDYVLCSVDMDARRGVRLGCDIEKVNRENLKLARKYFCPEEYEDIAACASPQERAERFCRYWVLKESFMKATRKGMALGLSSFEIRLGSPPILLRHPEEYEGPYYYQEYEADGLPYRIAVCSSDPQIDPKLQMELKLS